ncbi:SDR family oxidoreductase [Chloroflexota bacterium]
MKKFEGRVALVTGGGSGIGRASALIFAREGAKVVVANITPKGGEETSQIIEDSGGRSMFVEADIAKAAEVEALVEEVISKYGRLDCAHNNAGIFGMMANTADYAEEEWDQVIDINLKGVWLCMKYELRQMIEQGNGAIVNMSSHAGLRGVSNGMPAYVASKHGVVGLTKAAALEYAGRGIRVNSVCPSGTITPLVLRLWERDPAMKQRAGMMVPLGRMATAEEVAEAVVWLCSDAASFITGHSLALDGGRTAQ